jgi:hypothetical protein
LLVVKLGPRALLTREGIRRARQRGQVVGGLRPATARRNRQLYEASMAQADQYRELVLGCEGMSLKEISRVLFDSGVTTRSGKPWTHSMVRRLLDRLAKGALTVSSERAYSWVKIPAIPSGLSQSQHKLVKGVWQLIKTGNVTGLRWMLRMAARDEGQAFVDEVLGPWMSGPYVELIESVLAEA